MARRPRDVEEEADNGKAAPFLQASGGGTIANLVEAVDRLLDGSTRYIAALHEAFIRFQSKPPCSVIPNELLLPALQFFMQRLSDEVDPKAARVCFRPVDQEDLNAVIESDARLETNIPIDMEQFDQFARRILKRIALDRGKRLGIFMLGGVLLIHMAKGVVNKLPFIGGPLSCVVNLVLPTSLIGPAVGIAGAVYMGLDADSVISHSRAQRIRQSSEDRVNQVFVLMANALLALPCSQTQGGYSIPNSPSTGPQLGLGFPVHCASRARNLGFTHSRVCISTRNASNVVKLDLGRRQSVRIYAFVADEKAVELMPSMVPMMKKEYGAYGGGATLEKSKLNLSSTTTTKGSPQLEDGGGSGNIGKKNFHGGGDGGDDGGDDDAYFGDDDEEDEPSGDGIFSKRIVLQEIFDRRIVDAVLKEWKRTISDLPAGLKRAFEMGLVSSAQMVRYLEINARPTIARAVSRTIPASLSRAFIGRMLADPGFLCKLVLEQLTTVAYGCWWEYQRRGDKIKQEWDIALCNVLTSAACNLAVVWSLAPSRSYGTTFKYDFQNTLQKLPNYVFDKSYPMREFDMKKRVLSLFYKAAELSLVGTISGAVAAVASKATIALRKKRGIEHDVSVPMPSVQNSALGYGAFLGISSNLRYQVVYGLERAMQENMNHIGFVILCSTALRVLNVQVGDLTRVAWVGMREVKMEDGKAYHRPSIPSMPSMPSMESLKRGDFMNGKNGIFAKRKVKRKVVAMQQ